MYGTAIIREEATDEAGFVVGSPITYTGSFEVIYKANKKGDGGECFGQIPGTQLTTKNYDSRTSLRHALSNGGCLVK